MANDLRELLSRAQAWVEQGRAAGWLGDDDAARLAGVESRRPGDLVQNPTFRPLVVALFGGTGVGKSSLLNRIAGEPIARVGVERPTSREVTLYLHASIELADLPPELPLDRMTISRHHNDACREILWIDAPDIDSTEAANRSCALAWLPHTHLVCYVVSPERYKDDAGWRILRERGDRHGWMFILNRWDEGHALQRDDFARLLREAGFESPLIATTSCANGRPTPTPDELDVIHRRIARLLKEHGVALLNQQAERARLDDLRGVLTTAMNKLGDDTAWMQLRESARADWHAATQVMQRTAIPAIQVAAQRIAARSPSVARRVAQASLALRGHDAAPLVAPTDDTSLFAADLWESSSALRLASCLDAIEVKARQAGLTAAPIRDRLDTLARRADGEMGKWIGAHASTAPRMAGSGPRRLVQLSLRWASRVLPAAGLCIVAYAVILGYWRASTGQASFLGGDFAIHSTLFVLLLWMLPALLERWIRPSIEAAAHEAVTGALAAALARLGERIDETLRDARQSADALAREGAALFAAINAQIDALQSDNSEPVRGLVAARAPRRNESQHALQASAQ